MKPEMHRFGGVCKSPLYESFAVTVHKMSGENSMGKDLPAEQIQGILQRSRANVNDGAGQ